MIAILVAVGSEEGEEALDERLRADLAGALYAQAPVPVAATQVLLSVLNSTKSTPAMPKSSATPETMTKSEGSVALATGKAMVTTGASLSTGKKFDTVDAETFPTASRTVNSNATSAAAIDPGNTNDPRMEPFK